MKVHFTDALDGTRRTVDRPLGELLIEVLAAPFLMLAALCGVRGGWGH
jgi:hypothetical protein